MAKIKGKDRVLKKARERHPLGDKAQWRGIYQVKAGIEFNPMRYSVGFTQHGDYKMSQNLDINEIRFFPFYMCLTEYQDLFWRIQKYFMVARYHHVNKKKQKTIS